MPADQMPHRTAKNAKSTMRMSFYQVKETIDEHIQDVHTNITSNAVRAIEYVQKSSGTLARLVKRPLRTSQRSAKQMRLDPSLYAISQLWDQVAASREPQSAEYPPFNRYQEAPKRSNEYEDDDRLRNRYQADDMKNEPNERVSIDTKLDFEGWRRKRQISRQGAKGTRPSKVNHASFGRVRMCFWLSYAITKRMVEKASIM